MTTASSRRASQPGERVARVAHGRRGSTCRLR
jgi:hypothetical protein